MNTDNRNNWTLMNQQYLLGSLRMVRLYLQASREEVDLTETLTQTKNDIETLAKSMTVEPALRTVCRLFHLGTFEEHFLMLCAGMELDANIAKDIFELSPELTFGMALSILPEGHWSAISPDSSLRYWKLIHKEPNGRLTNASCRIDEHILHFLLGISQLDHQLEYIIQPVLDGSALVPSHVHIADYIKNLLPRLVEHDTHPVIQIQGGSRQDRISIINHAFSNFNVSTYTLPLSLIPHQIQELKNLVLRWNRTALLNNFILYLDGDCSDLSDKNSVRQINYLLEHLKGVVVFGGELDRSIIDRGLISITVDHPNMSEQNAEWNKALGPLADNLNGNIEAITSQFNLDTHSIWNLAKLTRSQLNGITEVNEIQHQIWRSCCEHTRPALDQLGQRIHPRATWDDLVLPEHQLELMKMIVTQVMNRQKVYYDWGFAEKSNRGLGISALFSGESGTGKTMASEVLANALNLDLYRIDLSQVVNKYIGETEKNLRKIFDAAEGSGAILLFDEADALFGKRSEVKDSHDRYSNIEVSFLLQKMEEYKGLAILTTNMKNALDKAFLRRIRFVVQFPFPDASMRMEIWRRIFPHQTPIKDLNFKKLAGLNVAGGNIRNIALNASFLAAGKKQPVSMEDIHMAAKNEYLKLEKQMSTSESLL